MAELNRVLPEAFSEGKIDWEKLKAVLGENVGFGLEKFSFGWAGKMNAIKNALTPGKATLKPAKDESVKFDESENLFIEGDNLEVLKLLQKAYFEKIKMIYIDPPYNTGGDFVYKDNFTAPLKSYLEQTGQIDGNGNKLQTNKETGGRYHSDWLSMMYPRLKLAWNLLRDDGVIFISIDDNEVHHLRMIMDEIFGEENFEGMVSWRRRVNQPNDETKMIAKVSEYILIFSKSKQNLKDNNSFNKISISKERLSFYTNPDNDFRGDWSSTPWCASKGQGGSRYEIITPTGVKYNETWLGTRDTFQSLLNDNKIIFPNSGKGKPRKKIFKADRIKDGQSAINFWFDGRFGDNLSANREMKDLFGDERIFDYPKPTNLVKTMLEIATSVNSSDIILDFFAGSGTMAQAVMELNAKDGGDRKWICVQLPEAVDIKSEAYKAGYKTIADIAKERIRRVIAGYGKEPKPINDGFKVFKLAESNYPENNFEFDPEKPEEENKKAFLEYLAKARQGKLFDEKQWLDIVYENIIKEGLSLNSKIATAGNKIIKATDGEKQIFLCLENKIGQTIIKELTKPEYKEKIFICLDNALDDSAKANLALNVELKTI